MTRPMPGPPTHDRYARPHRQFADERCSTCYAPGWTLPKWLTDAECAAHYWQAFCYRARALAEIINLPPHEARRIVKESDTWHRFGTHHHALEEA